MGLKLMRPSAPHIIATPATLSDVAENIQSLSDAVVERIRLIPAYKARHGHGGTVQLKQETAHQLKLLRKQIDLLEKEISR